MTTPPLIARQRAAQAVHDKFVGKPFTWWDRDCIGLGAQDLRAMGYPNPLKGTRPYRGEVGALRALADALKRVGGPKGGTLADLLDAMGLERIAPAEALPADLVGYPQDGAFGVAVGVAVGNGRALAFNPATGVAEVGNMEPAITAWRVHPCL